MTHRVGTTQFLALSCLSVVVFVAVWAAMTTRAQEARPVVELQALTENVWLHTSYFTYADGTHYPSNGLVVRNNQELILVDTAWGAAQTVDLLDVIAVEIALPVTKAVVTHAHGDRVAGVDALKARGIQVFAHPLTKQLTRVYGLPEPDNTIDGLLERGKAVKFEKLELFFPGAAHAPDNIMVWLAEEEVLFAGCAVRALEATSLGHIAHADIASWRQVMLALEHDFAGAKLVVPGHGQFGDQALIKHTRQLIEDFSE